KGFLS
ncbi:hypothetical protein S40288_11809, partial [Stachybotrys chartarum IBT 40288]